MIRKWIRDKTLRKYDFSNPRRPSSYDERVMRGQKRRIRQLRGGDWCECRLYRDAQELGVTNGTGLSETRVRQEYVDFIRYVVRENSVCDSRREGDE